MTPPDDPIGPGKSKASPQEGRNPTRQLIATFVIGVATAQVLGMTLRMPSQLEANDISRWCTVWALLERGTYAIDGCPWQHKTQDKVAKPDKLAPPEAGASPLRELEYRLAPVAWKTGEATTRFYSSKPPLLPTLIAGLLYPFRVASGVPLDRVRQEPRLPRNVEKPVEGKPGEVEYITETDRPPVLWPAHIYYFKPIILLVNIAPFLIVLVLYARLLDRSALGDWAWAFSLFAAAWGTYLFTFDQTLNNHTVAANGAFFALYALWRIVHDGERRARYFALAGFFGGFCACNELPAALFGALLFALLFVRAPGRTLAAFVPAAAVPIAAFLATQFLAFGQFTPVYEEFGTKAYEYEGSYWNTPLEFDWFNKHPEPYGVYLFHMTLGHHGVFSLTPIFLLSLYGALRGLRGRGWSVAWLTLVLTAAMLAFYTWNPKARNYGGSTQGLRWLFWLIPFWLVTLPMGLTPHEHRPTFRRLALALLFVSVLSVGYAMRAPWSHPWILDLTERLGWYHLNR